MIPAWLGWLVVVALIAAGIYAYRIIKRRQAQPPNVYAVRLPRFAAVHLPVSVPRDQGESFARQLCAVYGALWPALSRIYDVTPRPLFIDDIALVDREVEPDHPHVVWPMPRPQMTARIQPALPFWFAAELHNIFRFQVWGVGRVKLKDFESTEDERRRYYEATKFIREQWPR